MATVDDAELARRAREARDDHAVEGEIFRRFAGRIRGYGRRHLGDDDEADDLVQQVLVVVMDSLRQGRVREPARLASFVLGTCRMLARDRKRTESRRRRLRQRLEGPPDRAPDPLLDRARLLECLERLPQRERTVVIATFFGEQTSEDIASSLAMTTGNVRVVRHRAIARLQSCMGVPEGQGT